MTPEGQPRVRLGGPRPDREAMVEVPVELGADSYRILVGERLLPRLGELYPPRSGARGALVTGEPLVTLHAVTCLEALRSAGWTVVLLTVPDGEESKSLAQAERLYEGCLDGQLDRGSTIFALGGGVIGDLAGFVAATYMRGLPFVQLPTTLLAQVDASVGGKTAVDLPRGKNLVGAFHQPALVVIDVAALATLPDREFRAGMAEVVKHAAIADAELFAHLEQRPASELRLDPIGLRDVVARNCQVKADVVAADPTEKGLRACLNYGHTVGHALEVAAAGWDLRHGEAVALGMVAESRLAVRLGLSLPEVAERLEALLAKHGPLSPLGPGWALAKAESALRHDKKVVDGRLRLPVVPAIGQVTITGSVPVTELLRELAAMHSTGV